MFDPGDVKVLKPLSGIIIPSGARFYDNSMLDCYRVCPRKFYYRHIRHFEIDRLRIALMFGSSWHAAMDFVWDNARMLQDHALVSGGKDAFMSIWTIPPEMDFDNHPRTPAKALTLLDLYVKRYGQWLRGIEILAIEQPFIVPLVSDDIYYIGKLDKVIQEQRRIWFYDHKTTNSIKDQWSESFSPSGQMDGYLHAGHTTYSNFSGVMIDGVLVQKTSEDFKRIPVMRQVSQIEAWLWEVEELIDQIMVNEERLLYVRDEMASGKVYSFLPAFPKCTSSCTTYYGLCPFIDLCKFIDNPETVTVPEGFTIDKWQPFHINEAIDGSFDITITDKS